MQKDKNTDLMNFEENFLDLLKKTKDELMELYFQEKNKPENTDMKVVTKPKES